MALNKKSEEKFNDIHRGYQNDFNHFPSLEYRECWVNCIDEICMLMKTVLCFHN